MKDERDLPVLRRDAVTILPADAWQRASVRVAAYYARLGYTGAERDERVSCTLSRAWQRATRASDNSVEQLAFEQLHLDMAVERDSDTPAVSPVQASARSRVRGWLSTSENAELSSMPQLSSRTWSFPLLVRRAMVPERQQPRPVRLVLRKLKRGHAA
jgi:hypothetical protein